MCTNTHISLIFIPHTYLSLLLFDTAIDAKGSSTFAIVHVLNLEVKDSLNGATRGAKLILELCNMVRCDNAYKTDP